jgi:hypothetical protein
MDRDTLFICHATPDDNDFVRWLGTRLTGHGYRVWADLFELKGGTPFWGTIEEALRHHARKVIYVVSQKSVDPQRTGVRNELSVADAMRKALADPSFIIPVRIDDTPFGDLPIQVHTLNAIDFTRGWGAKLLELLDTLEAAKVQRFSGDLTVDFEKWRTAILRTSTTVEIAPEPVLTNLLGIRRLPQHITFFEYEGDNTKIGPALKATSLPHAMFNRHIIAFARGDVLQERLSPAFRVKVRVATSLLDFLDASATDVTAPRKTEARNTATYLLRSHIERYLEERGLKRFETSSAPGFYFPEGLIPNNKVFYLNAAGSRTHKAVVGRSERNKVNWHLAMKVNVVLGPPAYVRFKPYICFSENGQSAINDPKRTSAIRRRFCKNWWNQQWRQLQQAFCAYLAEDSDEIIISLDGNESLILDGKLLQVAAARRMPEDLKFAEEPEDPDESGDDDDDDEVEPDDEDEPGLDGLDLEAAE